MSDFENETVEQEVIIDALDGTPTIVRQRREQVVLDANGGRHFHTTTASLRAIDGRVLQDGAHVYACRSCGTEPLSQLAIVFCSHCQAIVCRACAKELEGFLCPPCHAKARRKRFWRWLASM